MKILLSFAAGLAIAFAICVAISTLAAIYLNREKHDP